MATLDQIFSRSSFRRGADRTVDLPTAYEVDDLVIPAGTFWRDTGPWADDERYLLGSIEVPRARGLIMVLYLELADFPATGDQVHIHGSTETLGVASNSTNLWNHTVIGGSSNTDLTPYPDAADPWIAEAWIAAANVDEGNPGTTEDIRVVRARASFQVL